MVEDEVTALCNNVVHDAFHVPRIRASCHVPEPCCTSVHRRKDVPTRAYGESHEHCEGQHNPIGVLSPPDASGARLVTRGDIP